jgi:hypothetical protein
MTIAFSHKTKRRSRAVFVLTAAATCLLLQSEDANAYWVTIPASGCRFVDFSPDGQIRHHTSLDPMNGAAFASGASSGLALCPYTDDETRPYAEASEIAVFGHDSVTQINAVIKACVALYQDAGLFCGASVGTGNVGAFRVTPPLTAWQNFPDGFAYVSVGLPRTEGTGGKVLLSGVQVRFP